MQQWEVYSWSTMLGWGGRWSWSVALVDPEKAFSPAVCKCEALTDDRNTIMWKYIHPLQSKTRTLHQACVVIDSANDWRTTSSSWFIMSKQMHGQTWHQYYTVLNSNSELNLKNESRSICLHAQNRKPSLRRAEIKRQKNINISHETEGNLKAGRSVTLN